MWVPKELSINNFRSIKEQKMIFVAGKTFLLQGKNNTDVGFVSNGSGKSSFREAIHYVLGLPVYAAIITDVIRDGEDFVEVTMTWENLSTKKVLYIERGNNKKGPKLTIKINGKDQNDFYSTIPEGDKYLLNVLGVPREDILNYFIISRERFVSFFNSSDTAKKDLISRFSNSIMVDGVFPIIEKDKVILTNEETLLTSDLSKLFGRLDVYNEELAAIDTLSITNSDRVKNLEQRVENLNGDVKRKQAELLELQGNEKKLKTEFNEVQAMVDGIIKKIEVKQPNVTKLKEQIDKLEVQIGEARSFLMEVNTLLSGVVKCPSCAFEFNPGEDIDVVEARGIIPEVQNSLNIYNDSLFSLKEQKDLLNAEIDGMQVQKQNFVNKVNAINNAIRNNVTQSNNVTININQLNSSISALEIEIKKEQNKDSNDRKKKLEEDIMEVTKQIKVQSAKIDAKKEEVDLLLQWNLRFTRFKTYLANKSLNVIQGYANYYLDKMGTNLGVRIEGFKQNKDGSVREKITPIILRDGNIEGTGSYKKYSTGERARIDIAILIAMRHLINQASNTGGIDLLFLDEITEGLDAMGVENICRSINELGITSMVVSHVGHESVYENVLTAIKENNQTILR